MKSTIDCNGQANFHGIHGLPIPRDVKLNRSVAWGVYRHMKGDRPYEGCDASQKNQSNLATNTSRAINWSGSSLGKKGHTVKPPRT